VTYFAKVPRSDLDDDALAWKVAPRCAPAVEPGAQGHRRHERSPADPTWAYWKARPCLRPRGDRAEKAEARACSRRIAGVDGFYEQLALEELGQRVTVPPAPQPLTPKKTGARTPA
jgi:soluble lytic murein transglycosylase